MLSEEETPSVTNSPIVTRRRLGSYSGDSTHLGATKEDTCSPGKQAFSCRPTLRNSIKIIV